MSLFDGGLKGMLASHDRGKNWLVEGAVISISAVKSVTFCPLGDSGDFVSDLSSVFIASDGSNSSYLYFDTPLQRPS